MITNAIIQARMSSSRLPGKVLMYLGGQTVLGRVVQRAQRIPGISTVIVATSTDTQDDAVEALCNDLNVPCFRGNLNDVLQRFSGCAAQYPSDYIMRLTADCPLLDPDICAGVLQLAIRTKADYASNVLIPSWPDGLDCEVISSDTLMTAAKEASSDHDREHVTSYVHSRRSQFKTVHFTCPIPGLSSERWTLDSPEDHEFLTQLLGSLSERNGHNSDNRLHPSYTDVLEILDLHPSLRKINQGISRNEGSRQNIESYSTNNLPCYTQFERSTQLLDSASQVIPLGSQTFSKSKTQFPVGHAPLFASHGVGGRLIDVDGNEYVDMVNALLPNILGYNDPDVEFAIRTQLSNGISLSLASTLEAQVAEKICDLVPSAEMVRFGKNGSDATSASVRLARAVTGRDHVISIGYHGWHDWYIGATSMNKGVPSDVQTLTHTAPYNDLESVEQIFKDHPGKISCLIMEPMNTTEPNPGYLESLKKCVHSNGAILIFDEIITGFRFDKGGAQSLFNVTPDLTCLGKSLGNGMPISVIAGRASIMKTMEDIFFSGTFGGETLSLVAANAVIDKICREPVIERLYESGQFIKDSITQLVSKYDLDSFLNLTGRAPWTVWSISDHESSSSSEIKTFILYYLYQSGVLCIGSHNMCYAHTKRDLTQVIAAYELAFSKLKDALKNGPLGPQMPCPVVEPLFKVRNN